MRTHHARQFSRRQFSRPPPVELAASGPVGREPAVYGNDSGPRAAHSARCRRKLTRRVARQAQAPGDQRISGHRGQARDRRWSFVRQLALMVTQAALR